MANAHIYTTVTGLDTNEEIDAVDITFPYLKKSHLEIRASSAGATLAAFKTALTAGITKLVYGTDYTVSDAGLITFIVSGTFANGSVYQVQVKRNSNLAARYVDFADGSVVTETNLDDAQKQQIYLTQELADDKVDLNADGTASSTHTLDEITDVTASAAEVNIMDGVTASTAEINILDGVTASTAEINIMDGVTASTSEVNMLDALDTDLSSVSGSDDTLASAKAIKTYVDTQLTAEDLDFAGDSGTGSVDLDSQTLTIGTGANLTTAAASQALTINLDSTITGLTSVTSTDFIGALTGNVTGNVSGTAANVTGTVAVGNGGTGFTSLAIGDVLYASATDTISKLTKGSAGQILAMNSGETAPEWSAAGAGSVTSVGATSDSGSITPITTAGTITFAGGTNVTTSATGSTVTINSTDQYAGTVTSITGAADSGSGTAITGTGTLTFTGGTGVTTAVSGTTVTVTADNNGTVTGTGSANQVALWNGTSALDGDADLVFDGTNLGIGTTAPAYNLQVTDSADAIVSIVGANDGTASLYFGDSVPARCRLVYDNTDEDLAIYTDNNERIRIDASGNVGIGTTAPTSLLDIEKAGTAKSNIDILELTNTGNAVDMDVTRTSIVFNQWYYDASTPAVADSGRIQVGTETDWTSTASTQDSFMAFMTGLDGSVSEKVRISSAGNVGIGTTDPATKLDVYTSTATTDARVHAGKFRTTSTGNMVDGFGGEILLDIDDDTASGDTVAKIVWERDGGDAQGKLAFVTRAAGGYNDRLTIDSLGNVGIGTASPSQKLSVVDATPTILNQSSAGDARFYAYADGGDAYMRLTTVSGVSNDWAFGTDRTDGYFKIADNSTLGTNDRLTIDTSGNVGIGTATPSQKLHIVNGKIAVSDGYNIGDPEGDNGMFINGETVQWQAAGSTGMTLNATGLAIGSTAVPKGTLHVHTGSAGSVVVPPAPTGADDLVVENSGTGGITILTPNANNARLNFGAPGSHGYAFIDGSYSAGTDPRMRFSVGTAGNTVLTIKNDGTVVQEGPSLTLGDGTDGPGELRLLEDETNGVHYTALKSAAAAAANTTYTLPAAYPGASGYSLTSTDAGVMSWTNVSGGGGGGATLTGDTNNTLVTVTGADAIAGEANLTFNGTTLNVGAGNLDINASSLNAVGDLDDPDDYAIVIRNPSTTGTGNGIAFTNDDATNVGGAIVHIDQGSNNLGDLAFYTNSASSGNPTERMRINSVGDVGIGAAPPTVYDKLAVKLGNDGGVKYYSAAQTLFQFWKEGSTEEARMSIKHGGVEKIHLRGDGDSFFNGGNVGIGESLPGTLLDLKGSGSDLLTLNSTSSYAAMIFEENGTARFKILTNDGSNGLKFHDPAGSERMRIDASGRVGIGTAGTPDTDAGVHLQSSDSWCQLRLTGTGTNAHSKLDFESQGTGAGQIQIQGTTKLTIPASGQMSGPAAGAEICIACSDETTQLETSSSGAAAFLVPRAMTITEVKFSLSDASSVGDTEIDIRYQSNPATGPNSGSTIFNGTKSITSGDYYATVTGANFTGSVASFSCNENSFLTVDIDTVGSGDKGLKVWLLGYWTT